VLIQTAVSATSMWLVGVVALAACSAPNNAILSAAECTDVCVSAGADAETCRRVCGATCNERCVDYNIRVGGGLPPCARTCAMTCTEFQETLGFSRELCAWIVENRPSPTFTSPELAR
jgi:hypothetical protein